MILKNTLNYTLTNTKKGFELFDKNKGIIIGFFKEKEVALRHLEHNINEDERILKYSTK